MDISSTGFRMESPRQMHMIVLADLMRAYGGSSGRTIVLLYMCSVCALNIWLKWEETYGSVTHGLMSRVFLMKWYHFSVEYFEDLRNVNHCEFLIMRKSNDSGKYILENNLRTWSQLKAERLAAKEKEKNNLTLLTSTSAASEKDKEKEKKLEAASSPTAAVPTRKKWGGCPNGCDHGKHYFKKENSMHAMQLNGRPSPSNSPITAPPESIALPFRRPRAHRWQSSSGEEDEDDPRGRVTPASLDVQKSLDEQVSSPDGTPSFISIEDRLRSRIKSPKNELLSHMHLGRDFGGSASGNTSLAGSDAEFSAEEDLRRKVSGDGKGTHGKGSLLARGNEREHRKILAQVGRKESGMGRGAMADALGDQSDVGSDAGSEAELTREEEGTVRGDVY